MLHIFIVIMCPMLWSVEWWSLLIFIPTWALHLRHTTLFRPSTNVPFKWYDLNVWCMILNVLRQPSKLASDNNQVLLNGPQLQQFFFFLVVGSIFLTWSQSNGRVILLFVITRKSLSWKSSNTKASELANKVQQERQMINERIWHLDTDDLLPSSWQYGSCFPTQEIY